MAMNEVWKDIEGYEGFYQVSNKGNVKSIAVRRSLHGVIRIINREKIMKPYDNGNGYLMVCLRSNGDRQPVAVHRLVAKAFLDEDPERNVVNHIDRNTHNNNVENLEWVTTKENVNWSAEYMRKPKAISKASKTGEKYISIKDNRYRVQIKHFHIEKRFKSIEDAVTFRDSFIFRHPEYFGKWVV
jgi:hypothetical protein